MNLKIFPYLCIVKPNNWVEMKKSFTLLIALMMPILMFGDSYSSLWKKVEAAGEKDLPKTEYELLQKIVKKASKNRDYGQLLKAGLQSAQVMASIAPDSLKPAVEEMKKQYESADDEVLRTVWQTVLWRIDRNNYSLTLDVKQPILTADLCEKLAQVKDKDYAPFVIPGVDASIFDHDLLHVVGYELNAGFEEMYNYYKKVSNRRAACIVAAKVYWYASNEKLDPVIREYEDLPEAGELALLHYHNIAYDAKGEKMAYIGEALNKWGSWKRLATLRNERATLTNPQFRVAYDFQVSLPGQSQEVALTDVRNVKSVTMKVYKVKAGGDYTESPNYKKGYEKIKPLLDGVVYEQTRQYEGKKSYELFDDTMTLEGLPVGLYMVEFSSNPSTETIRCLYNVTDVFVIAEDQPSSEGMRYVVVSASTGQPLAGAHLRIREYLSYAAFEEYAGVTDAKGEYIFKSKFFNRKQEVYAWTDSDNACPPMTNGSYYRFYGNKQLETRTCIFTDRAIYRPGQKVCVSALLYQVKNGMEQSVRDHVSVTFRLRDANGKVVSEQKATTDDYGTCATEFTLPSSGLTGRFSIQVNTEYHYFRVEEYKRPTFHVDFPEVKQSYAAGDTLTVKATAMTYAGVPVQDAKVKYTVTRRRAYWWWSYSRYWDTSVLGHTSEGDEVYSGEAVTDANGQFDVTMPLTMPETSYPMFYQFVVKADVTDAAGETHDGQLSLPLGNRKQALSVDLAEKMLLDDQPTATFHLLNAAGKDIDAEVRYRIDGGKWQKVMTTVNCSLSSLKIVSGEHTLEAVCEGDTIERRFVVFSLDDERPATKTDDWFWQSAAQFPNDGTPITVQVGSSDADVHIVYSIFADDKVIKRGAVDKSDQLLNLKLTYEEAYGNGLLLTFAWVKNGQCHTHTAKIQRPLPDKKLHLEWSTFRNRLTPGQQEEWTLTVKDCEGRPVDAQLMATLYDKSLDMLTRHQWSFVPYLYLPLPTISWTCPSRHKMSASASRFWRAEDVNDLVFSSFDDSVYPTSYGYRFRRYSRGAMLEDADGAAVMAEPMVMKSAARMGSNTFDVRANDMSDGEVLKAKEVIVEEEAESTEEMSTEEVQVRENLNETAFFYPQLTTDETGCVALKFTLPESLTTWRFMGMAHTRDLFYGLIDAEAIAQKDVMIQPNVPRFLREGDEATISARIFNTSEKDLSGKAVLKFINPETDAVVSELSQTVKLKAGETTPVTFNCPMSAVDCQLLICQMSISGKGFSDGEQHYLPILPAKERVTITLPITQHHAGTETVDLASLIPADGQNAKLTFEYTNNPAWLLIQALPSLGTPSDDNAISQAASFYANAIGRLIISRNPQAKTAFELWKHEDGETTTLHSQLEKNEELKDLLLNETPWVLDAERETEQRQRLADFFDDNLMQNRLSSAVTKLDRLQLSNGAWTWWKDMPGSFYITVAVSEMLVRLNAIAGVQPETSQMLNSAFRFMGQVIIEEVEEMKKWEREGHSVSFPSFKALQWLYLATLDGRMLPDDVQSANNYLLKLLKKDIKSQSIYEKALTSVILSKSDSKRAAEYAQSLKEYTVFREDMGRYYDTPRAGYSWYDYKIPTQTVAIEALQLLTPDDRQTIEEMQRWLLQEKRTQAWDTPINSVNAVYAFLGGKEGADDRLRLDAVHADIQVDAKPLEMPKATVAIGYVKTPVQPESKTLTIAKSTEGTSWGAVYAQFTQATHNIADSGSGLVVKRELLTADGQQPTMLKVGDRVRMRITIDADRDYDFVQVLDKRAACLEPIRQLSGWHSGSYCTPKDYTTNYYFDCLSKGRHTIESEYFIDRAGRYETGTCTVQCAYAPEFRGTTKSQTIIIK